MKVVIIGGVAGGASAAARLRRLDEDAQIVMIERSGYVSYANCGMPYYVGGVIADRAKLTLQTPESFRARFDVEVRVRHEALRIDRRAKEVLVRDLSTGAEYREGYDKLVLSPGARPVMPDIRGADAQGVRALRTMEDAFGIYDALEQRPLRAVAVVGGGFIGVEMAENLAGRRIAVTLYQRPYQVLPMLDDDMAPFVHNHLNANGVDLRLGAEVRSITRRGDALAVRDADGEELFDLVVMAVGVAPESALAEAAGLELGVKGAVKVDAHMRTSDPDIYAVGDAVQVENAVSHVGASIPLAGPANRQGRIAADNICGIESVYPGSLGSAVVKVFKLTVAATGLTERAARAAGIPHDAVLIGPASHASYYPGAAHMQVKVVYDPTDGRLLGGQAVAAENADKCIDVVATAIQANMTVRDLQDLDLCYAPPYSSAKSPANFAGFAACNVLDGLVEQVRWAEALRHGDGAVLLDVRIARERRNGTLPGALWIPLDELRARAADLPAGKRLLVFCHTGLRSYIACRMLSQWGRECANIAGGFMFYDARRISDPATGA